MRKLATGAALAVLSVSGLGLATTGAADAASTTKPSTQDVTWMTANAQTDLAEISLGTLVASKSTNADTRSLAKVTKSQHKAALAKLTTIAKGLHVTLPTSPNTTQLAQATALKKLSGMDFNKTYDLDQIQGHVLSISQTGTEIAKGDNAKVVSFAKYYLPVAQMHLKMARTLKTELAH
jgi:predicted outer membrane protein